MSMITNPVYNPALVEDYLKGMYPLRVEDSSTSANEVQAPSNTQSRKSLKIEANIRKSLEVATDIRSSLERVKSRVIKSDVYALVNSFEVEPSGEEWKKHCASAIQLNQRVPLKGKISKRGRAKKTTKFVQPWLEGITPGKRLRLVAISQKLENYSKDLIKPSDSFDSKGEKRTKRGQAQLQKVRVEVASLAQNTIQQPAQIPPHLTYIAPPVHLMNLHPSMFGNVVYVPQLVPFTWPQNIGAASSAAQPPFSI